MTPRVRCGKDAYRSGMYDRAERTRSAHRDVRSSSLKVEDYALMSEAASPIAFRLHICGLHRSEWDMAFHRQTYQRTIASIVRAQLTKKPIQRIFSSISFGLNPPIAFRLQIVQKHRCLQRRRSTLSRSCHDVISTRDIVQWLESLRCHVRRRHKVEDGQRWWLVSKLGRDVDHDGCKLNAIPI